MSRKLFVGNLPYSVTSERLQEAFAQFGTVTSSKVIVDRETGRSRGFAFLEMETDDMGAAAMQAMNGALLDGRSIAVREAVERQPGGGGGGFGGGCGWWRWRRRWRWRSRRGPRWWWPRRWWRWRPDARSPCRLFRRRWRGTAKRRFRWRRRRSFPPSSASRRRSAAARARLRTAQAGL